MENEDGADRLLTSGHLYLWGDRLFHADKGEPGWSLLYIDRQTGNPLSPAPGALNAYILVRGVWYEALYKSADSDQRVMGASVDIDLTQFRDIASSIPTELLDGHIYSDGKYMFVAGKPEVSSDFVLTLYRINIADGVPVMPIVADSIAGYMQTSRGNWYVLKVGNQHTGRRMVTKICPEFESDILPKLEHIADSIAGYCAGGRFAAK